MARRTFYRDPWKPAQEASGLDIRPLECLHSYVTHLRAAGVNDADLADIVGHRVETMLARYTHPVGHGHAAVRAAIERAGNYPRITEARLEEGVPKTEFARSPLRSPRFASPSSCKRYSFPSCARVGPGR